MCGPPKPEPGHKSFEEAIRLNQIFQSRGRRTKGAPGRRIGSSKGQREDCENCIRNSK